MASANPHKVEEIAALLRAELGDDLDLLPRPPDVPDVAEDASTFEGNARRKAAALVAATGCAAVADDSGLEVMAMGGAPGVRSARYAGEDASDAENVAKLLDELTKLDARRPEQRRARFRTVALVARPDGTELAAEGTVDGHIALVERGVNGFGYDPVFVPDGGGGRTFAEMSSTDKHSLSHRGRAFAALAVMLRA